MTAKEMTLKIEHVFPQHFRTYYFEAENEKGVSVKEITLRKGQWFRNIFSFRYRLKAEHQLFASCSR